LSARFGRDQLAALVDDDRTRNAYTHWPGRRAADKRDPGGLWFGALQHLHMVEDVDINDHGRPMHRAASGKVRIADG
jgi:hypothetical protein